MVTAIRLRRPTAVIAELEALQAQRDLLRQALADVLKHCISDTQHMSAEPQKALRRARAALAELEGK